MAKDDYYVIAYQILGYLYSRIKAGKKAEPEVLKNDGPMYNIDYAYWSYIMINLFNEGYIKGITFKDSGDVQIVLGLDKCQITPDGIQYLNDNSSFKQAIKVLKEIKGFIPFELI